MARQKKVDEPGLLDLYAGFALVGVISRADLMEPPSSLARDAFEIAQAMLKRRQQELKDE
jgi:hypothetical protein